MKTTNPTTHSPKLLNDAELTAAVGAGKKRTQPPKTEPVKYLTVTLESVSISSYSL